MGGHDRVRELLHADQRDERSASRRCADDALWKDPVQCVAFPKDGIVVLRFPWGSARTESHDIRGDDAYLLRVTVGTPLKSYIRFDLIPRPVLGIRSDA
jgi:hypothetical protein